MNAVNLLADWPGWSGKKASDILFSHAWLKRVRWGDDEAFLRLTANRPRDIIALKIAFDGEEHFLGVSNRAAFPDLAVLWDRRNDIPRSLVLALVEKECGRLLQLLENSVRRQLTVEGLAEAENRAQAQGFEVVGADGSVIVSFALNVSPTVEEAWGDISAIDTGHLSIRTMTRPATVEYASFVLGAQAESLAPGDFLLMPELENPALAGWRVDDPVDDGKYRVRSAESRPVAFSSFADDDMPEIPAPGALELYRGSRLVATGRAASLGAQSAFAVEEVF